MVFWRSHPVELSHARVERRPRVLHLIGLQQRDGHASGRSSVSLDAACLLIPSAMISMRR